MRPITGKENEFEASQNSSADPVGTWFAPAVIQPNNFVYKSLSSWSYNIAVGCSHGCQFCYVPSAATIKQSHSLAKYGVRDPDLEWGRCSTSTLGRKEIFDFPSGRRANATFAAES